MNNQSTCEFLISYLSNAFEMLALEIRLIIFFEKIDISILLPQITDQ